MAYQYQNRNLSMSTKVEIFNGLTATHKCDNCGELYEGIYQYSWNGNVANGHCQECDSMCEKELVEDFCTKVNEAQRAKKESAQKARERSVKKEEVEINLVPAKWIFTNTYKCSKCRKLYEGPNMHTLDKPLCNGWCRECTT